MAHDNDKKNTTLKRYGKRTLVDSSMLKGHYAENGYFMSDNANYEIIPVNFENKLRQSRVETKNYYSILKNELLSYNCISKFEEMFELFYADDVCIARLAIYCGRVRLTLRFNKKKSFKKLREKMEEMDNILVSSGYIELYVDTDEKCDRALDLISVLMRDLELLRHDAYNAVDYVLEYPTIENGRFGYPEDLDKDVPEMVVVGDSDRKYRYIWLLLLIIAILAVLVGITTCTIYQTKQKDKHPTFEIIDVNGNIFLDTFVFESNIDIFNDPNYGGKKIIYPGREEVYYFYVFNNNNYPLTCSISFSEDNLDAINMRYRFRIADVQYNNAPWQGLDEIGISNLTIDANSKILCAIDWRWVDSDRDTEIGERGLATYTLRIHFTDFAKK